MAWGLPLRSGQITGQALQLVRTGKDASACITSHDVAAYRALPDAIGALVTVEGNALYANTERAVRGRVIFHAAAEDAHIDWARATETATALASA